MKINDKVIIAFLVSMGLFSSVQAGQYVKTLSQKDKVSFCVLASNNGDDIITSGEIRMPDTKNRNG